MILSSAGVAEEALRTIGVLSPYDTAAYPEEFRIALGRLSLLVDHLIGDEYLQFFYPSAQTIELPIDSGAGYDLNALLATDLEYITQVFLIDASGKGRELTLLRPEVYAEEEVPNPDQTGKPWAVSINRSNTPIMNIYPHITQEGYSARISGFRYSPNLAKDQGATAHGFPASWQFGLVYLLAADIGSGPVVTLPPAERDRLEEKGQRLLRRLAANNARDNVRHPRLVKPRDF